MKTGRSIVKMLERDGTTHNIIVGRRRYKLPMNLLMSRAPVKIRITKAFLFGGLEMILFSSVEGIKK